MSVIWMDVDAALAEVPVNIMPLIDDGDFKTVEDAVAYNASGMDLRWNFVTTAGAYTSTPVTPTTGGGDYDWGNQGDGMFSLKMPSSGGASINNDTEGFGWFSGKATGVLPWRGPTIGFRAAALNNLLVDDAPNAHRGLAGTALPAAAAEAAGGLFTRGTGAGQINQDANGRIDVNTKAQNGTSLTARDIGASVLLSSGTGTGQVSLSSGAVTVGTNNDKTGYSLSQTFPANFASLVISAGGSVKANLAEILGTALTETSGYLAAGFKKFFNVATPLATVAAQPAVPGDAMTLTTDYDAAKTAAQPGDEMDLVDAPNAAAQNAIATEVESHLLDEGDSQLLINAIVGAIGNTNIDQAILVAAIRADLERTGGNLNTLVGRLTTQRAANLDNLDAAVSSRLATTGYTAPDNSGIGVAAAAAATAATQATGANTKAAAVQVVTDKLNTALESDESGGYQFTTLALENSPAGGGGGDATLENQTEMLSRLAAIKTVTDKEATLLEDAGGGASRFKSAALVNAPVGDIAGDGSVFIDHNYGGTDELAYKTSGGAGIDNAVVQAFTAADYEAGNRNAANVQGETKTNALGRWVTPLALDPGDYVLIYYKQGFNGPDRKDVTVAA